VKKLFKQTQKMQQNSFPSFIEEQLNWENGSASKKVTSSEMSNFYLLLSPEPKKTNLWL